MKRLSIIIPHYNSPKSLKKLLDKLVWQVGRSFEGTEIIVVDDGSTCDMGWIKEYGRIKYIGKENGGVSSARNKGLEVASGDYITFIDADDSIRSHYVKTVYQMLKKNKVDYVVFPFHICKHGRVSRFPWRKDELKNYTVWGYAFTRECIGDERFDENINVGEDTQWLRRVLKGKKGIKASTSIYLYQWDENPDSLTKKYKRGSISRLKEQNGV